MKTWFVVPHDSSGGNMVLHYPTLEAAKEVWSDATITPIEYEEHLFFIDEIIKVSKGLDSCLQLGIPPTLQEGYAYDSDFGLFVITLFKDAQDGKYYNALEYTLLAKGSYVHPSCKTLTTPERFYTDFIAKPDFSFDILSMTKVAGKNEKLPKPSELKGIKQIGSAKLFGNKVSNPVFILNDDVYVKCNDYFSPTMKTPPEDMGTPLSYRMKKYFGKEVNEKFLYPDCWGAIVLRRQAWLKFTGYLNLLPHCNDVQIVKMCCEKIMQYHRWQKEIDVAWQIMLENICRVVRTFKENS